MGGIANELNVEKEVHAIKANAGYSPTFQIQVHVVLDDSQTTK